MGGCRTKRTATRTDARAASRHAPPDAPGREPARLRAHGSRRRKIPSWARCARETGRAVIAEFSGGGARAGLSGGARLERAGRPRSRPTRRRSAARCGICSTTPSSTRRRARRSGLRAVAANGRLTIRVRDRGIGVPVGERRAIFRKFVRGSTARRPRGEEAPASAWRWSSRSCKRTAATCVWTTPQARAARFSCCR